jgi:ATP-dependent 26S proteasome regulatory subunit
MKVKISKPSSTELEKSKPLLKKKDIENNKLMKESKGSNQSKETIVKSESVELKKSKKIESPIILKSGATDLRRQEKTLAELADRNYEEGIKPGILYAFSNKTNTVVKLIRMNEDLSITLLKVKRSAPYPWPDYHKKGDPGYTVELTGEKRKQFLDIIGCPDDL